VIYDIELRDTPHNVFVMVRDDMWLKTLLILGQQMVYLLSHIKALYVYITVFLFFSLLQL
jgi:hypothetical protein